ncbi:MAG: hypothetical protein HUK21_02960 [Fibrobacteraceae bacterium]|nr:hypothetical protein [Fibrobacteraceae bacterium]
MDKKKLKIIAIVDVVLIVGLVVLMMVLKGSYNEQAQKVGSESVGKYRDGVNATLQEQWKSVDQYGMAWRLVYATLTGDKSEASFNAAVKAIEGDVQGRLKQLSYMYTAAGIPSQVQADLGKEMAQGSILTKDEGGVKEVACGKNCAIKFTFAKGKLKDVDYKALAEYSMNNNFKVEAPAPFSFE